MNGVRERAVGLWDRLRISQRSLSMRVVTTVIVVEVVFGLLVGMVASLQSVRNAAAERRENLEHVANTVAASVMPVVADQDSARVAAQLGSVLSFADNNEIQCIRVTDSTGRVIAESEPVCTCDEVAPSGGVLAVFTQPQVVVQPITMADQPMGEVSIQFKPVGIERAFTQPMQATVVVVLGVVAISVLWGVWFTVRLIVEPIEQLRDGAIAIEHGERAVSFGMDREDEIGELAEALEHMAVRLDSHEQRLRASYDSLRTAYLVQEKMSHDLEESMRSRSDFVAVASHELRSPVAVIRVCSEMLEAGQYGDLAPEANDAVRSISESAERLGTILADLTDAAMFERGVIPVELKPIDIVSLVRQAVGDARVLGAARGVDVTMTSKLRSAKVRGDSIRLRQVLDNVLSNALKYSSPKDVVKVTLDRDGDGIDIAISDRGRGVPGGRRHVVFEPFGRVETGDDTDESGMGLGLAISMRIVRAHGGDIVLRDNPDGVGALFIVRLPVSVGRLKRAAQKVVRVV